MADEPTVPGEFRCPECGYELTKSVMHGPSGAIARDAADTLEACPNDRSILRPVLYADALNEAREQACAGMILLRKLKGAVDEAESAGGSLNMIRALIDETEAQLNRK